MTLLYETNLKAKNKATLCQRILKYKQTLQGQQDPRYYSESGVGP